jgi:ATP-binding cassette, subfamily F, member 3
MLTVNSLTKMFASEIILKDISFSLSPGERLGLVGPNGCGKTTLLRILAGEDAPTSGGFHFSPPGLRLGYLPQGMTPAPDETLGGFVDRAAGQVDTLSAELAELAGALASEGAQPALQQDYDRLLARLEVAARGAENSPQMLAALGLDHFSPDTPVAILSGGQKTRLALVGVLLGSPQLLLLDEPTNHLDIEMLEWLEDWLVNSPLVRQAGMLLVSHDRAFLDRTITAVLELDAQTHLLRRYAGNYSDYLEQKLAERQRLWQSYTDQQQEIVRLRRAAASVRADAAFKKGGKGDSGDKFAAGFFGNRSRRTVGRAKNIEHRLEHLLSDERIEKPRQGWQMKLDFDHIPESSRSVLVLEGLAVGYGEHVLLRDLDVQLRYGQRVALIGPNGSGKTTLLRTIAGTLPPLQGSLRLGSSVKVGYMTQEQETLQADQNALSTLRGLAPFGETEARAYLHQFLFSGDDVFTPLGSLSYGERSRLQLACLAASGCNLLLLDEPLNHLDIPSRSRFEQALARFSGTILAVVHDRYFIEGFASTIWQVRQEGLQIFI